MAVPSILIVEDEGIAAIHLEKKIEELGYRSAGIAFSAEEALNTARATHPDLVLLDIQLGGEKDGIDFAQTLRAEQDVPVIFVTAFSDKNTIERAKSLVPYAYLLKPIREEAIRSAVEMALQKHRHERQLRESEERFRSVFEKSKRGIAISDPAGKITQANASLGNFLETSPENLMGKSIEDYFQFLNGAPDFSEGVGTEAQLRSANGEQSWFRIYREDVIGFGKVVRNYIYFIDDIRDQRERELRLVEAKTRAEQGSKHRQELIAYLGHELKTPLSAMMGYADLLSQMPLGEKDKKIFLDRIRASGEYLSSFVQEILEFSRIEAGKLSVEKQTIRVSDLLMDIVGLLSVQSQMKGLSLRLDVDAEVPTHFATDPALLRHILINLVGNAIKFTDHGSVTLKVSWEEPWVSVTVRDTGCGISEEDQANLFRPFSQANAQIREKFGGTGMGLSLSRRFAEALGGELSLTESHVGRGSAFTLRLPVS